MKNAKYIIILFIMILSSGCANNRAENKYVPAPSPVPSPVQTPQAEETPSPEPVTLSNYSTKLFDKRPSRLNNIKRASDRINGKVINSGEIMSFNEIVGPRTKEAGYEEAIVYIHGEKVMGYGGGVCQLSTTIYNAALDAGLEIIERNEHQQEVQYAPKGKDAMVNYGTADLKIKNNESYPIKILTNLSENSVDVSILCIK